MADHDGHASVVRARHAVAEAWRVRGGPEPLHAEADYRVVQQRLAEYLVVAFPGIPEPSLAALAVEAVESHMARLLARPHWNGRRVGAVARSECDSLAARADDMALELRSGTDGASGGSGPRQSDDEWLVRLAVGAGPDAVRDGLRELVDLQARVDFLIVTQYLDLADRDRTRPPGSAEVVARLRDEAVSEQQVRRSILAFRNRLAEMRPRDV